MGENVSWKKFDEERPEAAGTYMVSVWQPEDPVGCYPDISALTYDPTTGWEGGGSTISHWKPLPEQDWYSVATVPKGQLDFLVRLKDGRVTEGYYNSDCFSKNPSPQWVTDGTLSPIVQWHKVTDFPDPEEVRLIRLKREG